MRKKSLVLLSGGFDSAANLAFCRERDLPVLALTADYGQRAVEREISAARALAGAYGVEHRVLDLKWLGHVGQSALTRIDQAMPQLAESDLDSATRARETAAAVWVPNRNGLLINAAASVAEAEGIEQIVVGFNREEAATFPDNTAEFLDAATESLRYSTGGRVRVASYTVAWDKSEIARELVRLGGFRWDLVWSCYEGRAEPCETCESCRRFARARAAARVQSSGATA